MSGIRYQPAVVIVTMFEPDTRPGELSHYTEAYGLKPLALLGWCGGPLRASADGRVMALVAGVGPVNTAISLMALGLHPEVDVSGARWLISGIAGGPERAVALGDVVLVDYCVDGDLAFEIDAREIPEDWPTGLIPLGAKAPYTEGNLHTGMFGEPYQCIALPAKPAQEAANLLQAAKLSFRQGAVLSAARFWHGQHHGAWACRWVEFWTKGRSTFLAASMEDSGTLQALRQLGNIGRADARRVVLLRAISNFTAPTGGLSAAESLARESGQSGYAGYEAALEAGFRAGQILVDHWLQSTS